MNMEAEDVFAIKSAFQVAGVSRPLMSVSKICDQGLLCIFDAKEARSTSAEGEVIGIVTSLLRQIIRINTKAVFTV